MKKEHPRKQEAKRLHKKGAAEVKHLQEQEIVQAQEETNSQDREELTPIPPSTMIPNSVPACQRRQHQQYLCILQRLLRRPLQRQTRASPTKDSPLLLQVPIPANRQVNLQVSSSTSESIAKGIAQRATESISKQCRVGSCIKDCRKFYSKAQVLVNHSVSRQSKGLLKLLSVSPCQPLRPLLGTH